MNLQVSKKKVRLILEDGSIYFGDSFGYEKNTSGEVVFSTGMVGYPESLTDPSYCGQILTLTYPLVGNYGIPDERVNGDILDNFESSKIQVQGLIVAEQSQGYSHRSAEKSLKDWLIEQEIPALTGIDTRSLTRRIRKKGVMLGKILFDQTEDLGFYDPNNENLVAKVSINEIKTYGEGRYNIAVIDCGMKNNILRMLLKRDVTVKRVPWNYNVSKEDFDGIFISNGPGNPEMCNETIENIKKVMQKKIPIFGICLGHQLLALAAGGSTYKLKYGHRSQNQPCVLNDNSCFITAQNHGYAVDMSSLSSNWRELFQNINDKSNEGVEHVSEPFFSVQFHPEGFGGPKDTEYLFDKFIGMIADEKK